MHHFCPNLLVLRLPLRFIPVQSSSPQADRTHSIPSYRSSSGSSRRSRLPHPLHLSCFIHPHYMSKPLHLLFLDVLQYWFYIQVFPNLATSQPVSLCHTSNPSEEFHSTACILFLCCCFSTQLSLP